MIDSTILKKLLSKYDEAFSNYLDLDLLEETTKNIEVGVGKFPKNFILYRGRKNIDKEKEDISNPKTFSYPPVEYCNENGRAHILQKPVFYCAEYFSTALFELRANMDDDIYIGIWRLKDYVSTKIHFKVTEENLKESIFHYTYKKVTDQLSEQGINQINNNEVFKEKYTEESYPYINSSLFSYVLLYEQDIDFIIYPSAQHNERYTNIAIRPEYIDTNMELDSVYLIKITTDSKYLQSIKLNQVGISKNNTIEWRNPLDSDFEYFEYIVNGYSNYLESTSPICFSVSSEEKLNFLFEDIQSKITQEIITEEDIDSKNMHSELFSLGMNLFREKHYLESLKMFNKAIKICIYQPKYYYYRAMCYCMLNNYLEAKQNCNKVIELGSSEYQYATFCILGQVYTKEKNYSKALLNYRLAYNLNKNDFVLVTKIGDCFIQANKREEAIKFVEEAIITNDDPNLISYIKKLKRI